MLKEYGNKTSRDDEIIYKINKGQYMTRDGLKRCGARLYRK